MKNILYDDSDYCLNNLADGSEALALKFASRKNKKMRFSKSLLHFPDSCAGEKLSDHHESFETNACEVVSITFA